MKFVNCELCNKVFVYYSPYVEDLYKISNANPVIFCSEECRNTYKDKRLHIKTFNPVNGFVAYG